MELWFASAMVSRFVREGNSYLPLKVLATEIEASCLKSKTTVPTSTAASFYAQKLLHYQEVVGRKGDYKPLILVEGEDCYRLYLQRLHVYEEQLGHFLQQINRQPLAAVNKTTTDTMKKLLELYCNKRSVEQKIAIYMAATQHLTIICGGPGTGKTSTITSLVGLYTQWRQVAANRLVLLAPTGKATLRLKEAFAAETTNMLLPKDFIEQMLSQIQTIHMFMHRIRYQQSHHLIQLVVVDEISMVSLQTMYELTQILGPSVQYVLVGDKDQLTSIEAASLMSDLSHRAEQYNYTPTLRHQLHSLFGSLPTNQDHTNHHNTHLSSATAHPFKNSIVLLQESHRFPQKSLIHQVIEAIKKQEPQKVFNLLHHPKNQTISFIEIENPLSLEIFLETTLLHDYKNFTTHLFAAATTTHPDNQQKAFETAFSLFFKWGILCPIKEYDPFASQQVNRMIENLLFKHKLLTASSIQSPIPPETSIDDSSVFYKGRPLMILQNDYTQNLYNGNIGFCIPINKKPRVCFLKENSSSQNTCRFFDPHSLPHHQTAYTMTVHKSQGSEFEQVLFILPATEKSLLTKELLYTGISRAKKKVILLGKKEVLYKCIMNQTKRYSGLKEILWNNKNQS